MSRKHRTLIVLLASAATTFPLVAAGQVAPPADTPDLTVVQKEAWLRARIDTNLDALADDLDLEANIGSSLVAQMQAASAMEVGAVLERARNTRSGVSKLLVPKSIDSHQQASTAALGEMARVIAVTDVSAKVTELRKYAQHLRNLRSSSTAVPIDHVLHALETEFVPDNVAIVIGSATPQPSAPDGAPQPFDVATDSMNLGDDLLPFIVGLGATTVDYPAVAALLYIDSATGGLAVKCTGTLIAPHVVLTAQHCLDVAGGPQSVFFQHAGSYTVAPNPLRYTPYSFPRGDLALLYLQQPVRGIEPVAINESAALAAASPGHIVGFGYHSPFAGTSASAQNAIVRKAGIKLVASVATRTCDNEFAGKNLICWTYPATPLDPLQGSTCHGDSGGPLFIQADQWRIAGITSGGSSCLPGDHAVDTEVFAYKKWIRDGIASQPVPAAVGSTQYQVLHPVANPTARYPLAISERILNSTGSWSKAFSLPTQANAMRVAVNTTSNGTMLSLAAMSPNQNVQCEERTDDTAASCEFRNPAQGTWKVAVSGAPFQEFQIVVTTF